MRLKFAKLAAVTLSTACVLAHGQLQDQSDAPAVQGSTVQPSQTPSRVRVAEKVSQLFIIKKVKPEYPQEASEKHIQGLVILKAQISKEGEVTDLALGSGHPLLVTPAITAVKQWKYKPYLLNGHPVQVETTITVPFSLDSSQIDARPKTPTGIAGDIPGGFVDEQAGGVVGGIVSSAPVATPKVAAPGRVRVSQGVMQGLLAKEVAPEYPSEAQRGRIEGRVVLHVIISNAGDVATVDLVSGHPLLAPAAIEAVKQSKYKPFLLNGKPLEVETQVLVNFTVPGG